MSCHSSVALGLSKKVIDKNISRDRSKAAYRRLIELFAIYSNKNISNIPSRIQLDLISALLFKLILFSEARDCIYYKLSKAEDLTINNSFFIENAYSEKLQVFSKTRFNRNLDRDVKYNSNKNLSSGNLTSNDYLKTVSNGFLLEYRMDIKVLFLIEEKLDKLFYNTTNVEITKEELVNLIKDIDNSIPDNDIIYFIDKLTLGNVQSYDIEEIDESKFWKSRRKFMLLFQPFIRIGETKLLFSLCQFSESINTICNSIYNGSYLNELITNDKFRTLNGINANNRAKEFEVKVSEKFSEINYTVFSDIKDNIKIKHNKADLGDIDVIAFDEINKKVFLLECKDRGMAITIDDMGKQLNDFRGIKNNNKPDLLYKHLRRTKWLMNNKCFLKRFNIKQIEDYSIMPIVVTSKVTPMSFLESSEISFMNFIDIEAISTTELNKFIFNPKWLNHIDI